MHMYLWVGSLGEDISNSVGMSRQSVDAGLSPHIPHTSSGISPSSHQHINSGVKRHAIDSTEVAVIVTHYLWVQVIRNKIMEEEGEIEEHCMCLSMKKGLGLRRKGAEGEMLTLLYSRSQHLTCLSSPAEKR